MDDFIINPEDLLNIDPNSDKANYIFRLLLNTTLGSKEVKEIEDRLINGVLKLEDAEVIIMKLQQSQIDKIDAGHNYQQKDIHNKLNKMGL